MSTAPGASPATAEVKENVKVQPPSIGAGEAIESSDPLPTDEPKLSAVELKKQKVAEKAARRAKILEQKSDTGSTASSNSTPRKDGGEKKGSKQKGTTNSGKAGSPGDGKHKKDGAKHESPVPAEKKKQVSLFNHLPQRKDPGSASVEDTKHIHLEVRALGLQMTEYIVCGSNARLVSMLAVLKTVIKEYETPESQSLSRHIINKVLTPQISHLSSCRPLSVSQRNAIRWLKLQISKIDMNTPEDEAKDHLCTLIDEFIRDKSSLAHRVIAEKGAEKIKDGDIVLTYAKSTVVEKTLRLAWAQGKKFQVIIVDNPEPLSEGKRLSTTLMNRKDTKDMSVELISYLSISPYMEQATKVLLGGHAMMSNGSLYSRIGTAGIALEAKASNVPVIVLCESIKFSDKAPSNSFDMNELAPVEEMLAGTKLNDADVWNKASALEQSHRILKAVEDVAGMNAFNLMYDQTPAGWIDVVISEHGAVPPTSVPVLNRLHNEADEI